MVAARFIVGFLISLLVSCPFICWQQAHGAEGTQVQLHGDDCCRRDFPDDDRRPEQCCLCAGAVVGLEARRVDSGRIKAFFRLTIALLTLNIESGGQYLLVGDLRNRSLPFPPSSTGRDIRALVNSLLL